MDMQGICKEYQWSDWSSLGHPGTSWDPKHTKNAASILELGQFHRHPGSHTMPHNSFRTVCFYCLFFGNQVAIYHVQVHDLIDILICCVYIGYHQIDTTWCQSYLLSEHLISHLPRWLSHWASKHWSFPLVDRSWPESRKVRIQYDTWNQEFSTKFYGTRPSVEMVKMSTSYMFIYINLAYVGIFWQFLILYII